ncbi:MAG: hypothetical protein Q9167_007441, partial [Letrouitia subvulpina]
MLQRLLDLYHEGADKHDITDILFEEFGKPMDFDEVAQQLKFLLIGPDPDLWTVAMEDCLVENFDQGLDVHDITNELFERFDKPTKWQETYRKIQELKLQ